MTTPFDLARHRHNEFLASLDQLRLLAEEQMALAARLENEAGLDLAGLREFLKKPYLLRHIRDDKHELIIPSFVNLQAGWPARVEGNYTIYQVSRFIDLLTPLPAWLRDELGFLPPAFDAVLGDGRLTVTKGDPREVWEELGGKSKFSSRNGNVLFFRPKSRFDIMRELVRQGILPYQPQPVSADLLRAPLTDIVLRPWQARDWDEFLKLGAAAVFATGGAGKTYFGLYAAAAIRGPKIVLAPRSAILEQWKKRLQTLCRWDVEEEVVFATYQSLLYPSGKALLRKPYSLVIFDEIQTLPSNTGLLASQIKAQARIGLSATPWREDGQEDLIVALAGFPLGHDWPSSPPPQATVWIVNQAADKLRQVRAIMETPTSGKTLIFVYRIEEGQRLAAALNLPFAHGGTSRPLDVIHENDVVVVSKIADAGVSVNATRVIEVDFLGGRTELGQRALRTRHAADGGELHTILTKEEYANHSNRLAALFAIGANVQYAGERLS